MAQQTEQEFFDETAADHIDFHKRILDPTFMEQWVIPALELMGSLEIREIMKLVRGVTTTCRTSYPVPQRRPVVNPSAMLQNEAARNQEVADNLERSQYYDAQGSPQASPRTPTNRQQQPPRTPRTPNNTSPSPRTPPQTRCPPNVPQAPLAPTGRRYQRESLSRQNLFESPQSLDGPAGLQNTPVARPAASRNRNTLPRFQMASGMSPRTPVAQQSANTPRQPLVYTSTPNVVPVVQTSTPVQRQNILPQFHLVIPSPDASAIRTIEADRNLTNHEIEQVNEVAENVAVAAGDDVFPSGAVAVSTRNIQLIPGKYKLYKVMRF